MSTGAERSNKELIIKAAADLLADQGYASVTISRVAEQAGLARGLIHYYFKSKTDLMVSVAQRYLEKSLASLERISPSQIRPEQWASALVRGIRLTIKRKPEFFTVLFELWVVGRQEPEVSKGLGRIFSDYKTALAKIIAGAKPEDDLEPGHRAHGAAAVISALGDGLALQYLAEPDQLDNQAVWSVAEKSVSACLDMARTDV